MSTWMDWRAVTEAAHRIELAAKVLQKATRPKERPNASSWDQPHASRDTLQAYKRLRSKMSSLHVALLAVGLDPEPLGEELSPLEETTRC